MVELESERVDMHSPRHVEAKGLELALVKASAELGLPQGQIAYRVLKKNTGIAAFFSRKKVALHVWPRTPPAVHSDHAHADPDVRDEPKLTPATEQEVIDELVGYCRTICRLVSGSEVVVTARRAGQRLIIDIDDDWLLSSATHYPKIIEALEHLLRKKPRHLQRSLPFRIFVDVKQHRIAREVAIVQRAKNLAARVIADQHPLTMDCKNPNERRVIHLALDNDPRIHTKSVGRGFERRLMILPRSAH